MENQNKFYEALDRSQEDENIGAYKKKYDEMELLKRENEGLKIALEKYNIILTEYQYKSDQGSEIFKRIEELSISQYKEGDMKLLVDNISLIREYEKIVMEKEGHIEYLNSQLIEIPEQLQKSIEENQELRKLIEEKEEALNKIYKTYLNTDSGQIQGLGMSSNKNDDLNNQLLLLQNNNELLLRNIENSKVEIEQRKYAYNEIKEKYSVLLNEYEPLKEKYSKIKFDFDELIRNKLDFERKIQRNNDNMIILDKENSQLKTRNMVLETENEYLNKEVNHYKEAYEDLENRKNLELEVIIRDLNQIKLRDNDNKNKIEIMQNTIDDNRNELALLRQENQNLRYDRDNLTKQIEETDLYVKGFREKEKNISTTQKAYKKKIDEAILEKEKSLIRQRNLENQINKLQEDYNKMISDCNHQHENLYESSKNKFQLIIDKKDEDLQICRSDLIQCKMERDRYYTEYSSLKKEYDKLMNVYSSENEKNLKQMDINVRESMIMQNSLTDKNLELMKKLDILESEKSNLENEVKLLRNQDSSQERLIQKLGKNEENNEKIVQKLKNTNSTLAIEKESLEKELERCKSMNETRIKQVTEKYEMKLLVLENSLKYQQEQYDNSENKAFEILKKQESITNKIKEEFVRTVSHYENKVEKLLKENNFMRKHLQIDETPEKI